TVKRACGGVLSRSPRSISWELTLDPALQRRAALDGGKERVPRLRAGMPGRVPEPLGIDDELAVARHGDARFRGGILSILAQNHVRVRIVAELEPNPDHPPLAVGVETVVVVEVQVARERLGLRVGVELDDADTPEVGADALDPLHQRGTLRGILGPDAVLVRFAVVPEAGALHLPQGRGDRRKVRVATALPVHVLKAQPFTVRDSRAGVIAQDDETLVGQHVEREVHPLLSPGILGDLAGLRPPPAPQRPLLYHLAAMPEPTRAQRAPAHSLARFRGHRGGSRCRGSCARAWSSSPRRSCAAGGGYRRR